MTDLILTVHTARHSYIVRRDDISELRMVRSRADRERPDERGRPVVHVDLGQFLDPEDLCASRRHHAMLVHLRRQSVALLVKRIEDLATDTQQSRAIQLLPPLLAQRLTPVWVSGVLVYDDRPILVLNLRQIARDVVLQQREKS